MLSMVYVCQTSVRPSVCPIRPPGLLLWARRAGDIDRLLHGRLVGGQQQPRRSSDLRRPDAGNATLSAHVGS